MRRTQQCASIVALVFGFVACAGGSPPLFSDSGDTEKAQSALLADPAAADPADQQGDVEQEGDNDVEDDEQDEAEGEDEGDEDEADDADEGDEDDEDEAEDEGDEDEVDDADEDDLDVQEGDQAGDNKNEP